MQELLLNLFSSINQPGSRLCRERMSNKTRRPSQYIKSLKIRFYIILQYKFEFSSWSLTMDPFQYIHYITIITKKMRVDPETIQT